MRRTLFFVLVLCLFFVSSCSVYSVNFSNFLTASSAFYKYSSNFSIRVSDPSLLDNLSLILPLGIDTFSQRIVNYSFYSHPGSRLLDFNNGSFAFVWTSPRSNLFTADISFFVQKSQPRRVFVSYSLPKFYSIISHNYSLEPFTLRTRTYDFDDNFKKLASSIVTNSSDEFSAVSKIVLWVNQNMVYNLSLKDKSWSASKILSERRGVCSHYSTLAIALLRSIGIPSREVSGFAYSNLPEYNSFGPHSWVEVFFPDVGWVEFDPTYLEFGGVDVSHFIVDPSAYLSWYSYGSVDVNFDRSSSSVSLIYFKNGSLPVNVSVHFFKDSVGLNSFNLVYASVKNLENFYSAYCFNISNTENVEVLSPRRVCVFLKPFQSENISWVVKVFGLDKMYGYTFPISVYNSFTSSESSFHAVATSPDYSLSQVVSFRNLISNKKESYLSKANFLVYCGPRFIYPYNKQIFCNVSNFGPEVFNVRLCLSSQCYLSNFLTHSTRTFVFNSSSFNSSDPYLKLFVGSLSFSYPVSVSFLKSPSFNFSISFVNFSDGFAVFNFSNVSSFGVSNFSVSVFVNGAPVRFYSRTYDRLWRIPLSSFASGNNSVRFDVFYEDFNHKTYSRSKTLFVDVASISFWFKLKMFLSKLVSWIESVS